MKERSLTISDRIRRIMQRPDWYNDLATVRGELLLGALAPGEDVQMARAQAEARLVLILEQLMVERAVMFGEAGPNWDAPRQPIDMVVLHHTGSQGPIRLSYLSALQLLQLYVPKYQRPGADEELIGGTPVYSGHAGVDGGQVFYAHHWLIRADGAVERLLPDTAIGWQTGDWAVNCRSVAICFDADLENSSPTEAALHSAVQIIIEHYPAAEIPRIVGHSDVVSTICPGHEFDRWGEELRALVAAKRA
jgi:hypothetical protein